jgi:phage shock protein A
MLKRLAILTTLIVSPALAQQAPVPDLLATSYAQLLTEANNRVASLNAQLQQTNQAKATLEVRIGDLEKQIAALKPKPDATPAPDVK